MSAAPSRAGSSVRARSVSPSLNLSKLAGLLSEAIAPANSQGLDSLPLMSLADGKVIVNTAGVLQRLFKSGGFLTALTPGDETGFVRDIDLPPYGTTARVGGRLLPGSERETTKSLDSLHGAIAAAIDEVATPEAIQGLAARSLDETLQTIARSVNLPKPELPTKANLVPVVFASNERKADERAKDIGRVLSAIESVDGTDGLDLFVQGVGNLLRKDGWEEDAIEDAKAAIRSQRKMPGSQIRQFLDFLDDEALSRVRLQVTMKLMTALSSQSKSVGFKAYVERVLQCYALFAGTSGQALPLDVSVEYGQANCSDLGDSLRKALFYTCLPVWPEWSVQLFETRTEPTHGFATIREVSYRFRVNGTNPETGSPSFDARLDRLHRRVISEEDLSQPMARKIAELVFLWLVIPDSISAPTPADLLALTRSLAADLKAAPLETLTRLHSDLLTRSNVVKGLARELVELLRNKSGRLMTTANNTADKFRVFVGRRIVNRAAFDSLTDKSEILVKPERGAQNVLWFQHLNVSDAELVPDALMSYSVTTELKERSIALAGDTTTVKMQRDLGAPLLAVRMVPYKWTNDERPWATEPDIASTFDPASGIEVQYDLKQLRRKREDRDDEKARKEQLRAAAIAATTLLIYMTLWELHRRTKLVHSDLTTVILRLQGSGRQASREDDAHDANTAIYAISQAVERALAREGAIKLQGLTTAGDNLGWKRRGALHAILGGQAVRFGMEGNLDKVALVTYVTRPCDTHPAAADADGHLFISRTYTAHRDDKGAVLQVERMRSRIIDTRAEFKAPQPVLEELDRLDKDGYQHVMLLSHHFGNRHIGRAAERHAPHGTLEFLDDAFKRFPLMRFYTLRRDVFPATRLRKRESDESAFEVLNFRDHQHMYDQHAADVFRGVMPVYTFATLAVVEAKRDGDTSRPQSGFCTYFVDVDERVEEARQAARADIMGFGSGGEVRKSLISVLRTIHFMESEKPAAGGQLLPVLDPFDWATPTSAAAMGEIEIMSTRRSGNVLMSLPAILAHVTKVLHKEER